MTALDDTRTAAPATPDRVGSAAAATKRAGTAAAKTAGATAARAFTAAASARDAAAGAAKAGSWAALCRLGRGLRYAGPDYIGWVLDYKRLAAYEAAEDAKDSKMMLTAEKERDASVKARKVLSAAVAMGVVAIWSGGSPYVTILWFVVTLAVLAMISPRAASIPGAAAGLSLLVEVVHGAYQVPDGWFTYGTPAVGVLALMAAARDGHVMPKADPAPAEAAQETARADAIEAAVIASVKGLDPESKPRVVEPGIAWTPDRSAWTATVDSGGPSGERLVAGTKDIAARLNLGLGRLFMVVDEDRGSRVHMTGVVGDPWKASTRSPLLSVQDVDLWEPIPFGRDITGQPVALSIPGSNFLFGGMPDYGKSTAAADLWGAFLKSRERSRLWVIDGGEVDTEPLHKAGLTHAWCTDPLEAAGVLQAWNAEIDRRQNLLAQMGKRKADREFFAEHGLGHDLLMWDEVASYTDNADSKLGAEITRLGKSALQRCRKAGMVMLLSTQSPSANALDSDARDTIHWRWAGWCRTRQMSDKILGEGAAARGVDASKLDRRVKGTGWLSTADGDRVVRPHFMADDDLLELIRQAVDLRRSRGLLRTGGEAPAELVAMAQVMRDRDVAWISAEELIAVGGAFDGHDPVSLAAALPDGVRTVQIKDDNWRRRYRLEDVDRALARVR